MTRFICLLFTVLNACLGLAQQSAEKYSQQEVFKHLNQARKVVRWEDKYVEAEEKELNGFIKEHILKAEDSALDSILFLKIKREYHYQVGNVLGDLYSQLKLLTLYREYLCGDELESLNRKVGEAFESIGNYELATAFFKNGLTYKTGKFKAYINGKLGGCFIQLEELDSATLYYKRALSLATVDNDRLSHLNSIGYVYFLKKDYVNAERFYERAIMEFHSVSKPDSIQYYIVQSNLGSLKIYQGKKLEGSDYLKRIEKSDFFRRQEDWFHAEIYSKLIKFYVESGECQKAEIYLEKLRVILPENKFDEYHSRFYQLELDLDVSCHSTTRAKQTLQSLRIKEREIEQYQREQLTIAGKLQYSVYMDRLGLVSANLDLRKQSEENLELSNSRLRRLVIISVILLIIIVLGAITWFVYKKRQQRRKEAMFELKKDLVLEKERANQLEMEIAEKELENRKLELKRMLGAVDRNSTLFQEVSSRLDKLRSKEGDLSEDISQLVQFIRSMSKADEISELLKRNSDLVDDRFKARFEAQFPNLSKSEVQLAMFIRLELSTKQIAQLKNVEPSSIRIFKHRLKQKLGLAKNEDLVAFIQTLNCLSK
ncbi:MAG: hypothetical protein P8P74_15040 [Crocinitomicaceae bacterium]|nr:hypothetical protein [Crocinitomicaceae bacterium]